MLRNFNKRLMLLAFGILLSALSFELSAVVNAAAAQEPKIKYRGLRFFETKNFIGTPDRVYRARFPKSKVRRVYYELDADNLLYQKENGASVIKARYKKPDGSLFGEFEGAMKLNSGDKEYYYANGLGWDDPGKWETGSYYVELFADSQPIPGGSFIIYDDSVSSDNSPDAVYEDFMLTKIEFFEGDQSSPAGGDMWHFKHRVFFDKSTIRYIWCKISVNNLNTASQKAYKVVWKYFNPDGTLRASPESQLKMVPSNYFLWVATGWGSTKFGTWQAGKYRVEVWIDGKKAGQDWFTVYEGSTDMDWSMLAGIIDMEEVENAQ